MPPPMSHSQWLQISLFTMKNAHFKKAANFEVHVNLLTFLDSGFTILSRTGNVVNSFIYITGFKNYFISGQVSLLQLIFQYFFFSAS